MEPKKTRLPSETIAPSSPESGLAIRSTQPDSPPQPERGLTWVFIGPQGLRAGWSVVVFCLLFLLLNIASEAVLVHFHLIGDHPEFSPQIVLFGELGSLLALVISVALMGIIERRHILDYNLRGSRQAQHFFFGLLSGFLALSVLIGGLAAGGWLHISHGALSGGAVWRFALLWGCAFLLGGCLEEGTFRCYGLFTLTRGINLWWALAIVTTVCSCQAIFVGGTASWGVYAAAFLGLIPCCILHQRAATGSGFWCAAWVTSTLFGFVHVSNPGEAWIGIFSAAFIGFVFCVSIRMTGSAWWAIGCHASWDWSETFFYGTADSGLRPHGSYLTSTSSGNPLYSGGTVGPEGSVLVLGVILLLLALLVVYGRFSSRIDPSSA